jgi:hypothetical protein
MPRVRIHNFTISLDGFATGEGQALETPFGHAGDLLHEWLLATRFGRREVLGEAGGTRGCRSRDGRPAWTRDRCGDQGRGQVRPFGLTKSSLE